MLDVALFFQVLFIYHNTLSGDSSVLLVIFQDLIITYYIFSCKQGSKRKEILACVKLSGMNAKRLCHDNEFSCFVTVDNPGHIHIMNVMKQNKI